MQNAHSVTPLIYRAVGGRRPPQNNSTKHRPVQGEHTTALNQLHRTLQTKATAASFSITV